MTTYRFLRRTSCLFATALLGILALTSTPAAKEAKNAKNKELYPVESKPASTKPASTKPAATKSTELAVLFDEDNKTFPLERFKTVRQGSSEWSMDKGWTWQDTIQLVRPTKIGTQAELSAKLSFLPLAKEGDSAETRLGFVFGDGQIGNIAFVRTRKDGKTTGELRFLREFGGPPPLGLTVRSFPLKEDFASATYVLKVRCGAVTVTQDGKEIAAGCFESHFAPAAGVVIGQEKGATTCLRLTLRGAEFPAEFTPERQELVKQASALNEEGKALYQEKKFDEAAAKAKEALELYRKAHADKHNDVANSLHNVATVLRNTEKPADAIPYYEEAIKIRGELFGVDHPDVALLELELTSLLVGRQKLKEAFPHCLAAHFSFAKYYGPENKNTIVTQQLLDKLPRPDKPDET